LYHCSLLYSLDENEQNNGIIENENMLIEEEIEGRLEDVIEMAVNHTYETDVNDNTTNMPSINVNDESQYDLHKNAPLETLDLKNGETDVKRLHCGNHKLNVTF
jgi:hypothetical protein